MRMHANKRSVKCCKLGRTRIDVYETVCPQQMLAHNGGKINNVELITRVGSADKIAVSKYSKGTAGILHKNIKKNGRGAYLNSKHSQVI